MLSTAAERILKCGKIVNIKCHDRLGAHRLKQRGHITRGHRIARLNLPIFARISQIRNNRCDACGGGVLQRADKEKKPAQLVIAALPIVAVERLNNEDILAADADQWPRLMLAILELTFLVQAGLNGKPKADLFTKGATAIQRKKLQLVVYTEK